jgi:tetratricopeptide (TPR) repeat protein
VGVRELKEEALDLYAQRRFAECVQTYERLLEINPRDPSLYMGQAEAYQGAGSRREALNAFRMAAELLLDQGDKARARAALKAALELNPRNKEVARALEELPPAAEEETQPTPVTPPEALFEYPPEREQPRAWQKSEPRSEPRKAEPPQAELRRLSDNVIAVRAGPGMPWYVVSSQTPLLTYEVDDLEQVAERSHPQEVMLQH